MAGEPPPRSRYDVAATLDAVLRENADSGTSTLELAGTSVEVALARSS